MCRLAQQLDKQIERRLFLMPVDLKIEKGSILTLQGKWKIRRCEIGQLKSYEETVRNMFE